MTTSLRISGLVKEYRAGRPVLNGIDLQIAGQGLTAIIGPSGTGKSTLLRCINRLIEPTKGEIVLQSKDGSVDLARGGGAGGGAPPPPAAASAWCSRNTTWSNA
jgi:phosphonate transport system ATP-binding protein